LARFLAGGDKVYLASVRFGFATTTDDLTGEPVTAPQPLTLDADAVLAQARSLTGAILQQPPAYSAKRVSGKRLYELARRGVAVERTASPVTVHAIELVRCAGDVAELEVRCSSGTYVRALAR